MQLRTPLAVTLIALTFLGCEPAPEDPLFAFGALESPDGTPTAGTISILRGDCVGHSCGGGQPMPDFPPEEPQPEPDLNFQPFTEVEAQADGTWMLEVTRFDSTIYASHGTDQRTFKAVAQPDPTLPPVEAVYRYDGSDVDLPPLRQWDPRVSVTLSPDAGAFEVSTAAAPPIPEQELSQFNDLVQLQSGRTGRYGLAFLDAEDREVWFLPPGQTTQLPLEVLEDFAVAWKLVATHAGNWFAPTLLGGQTFSTVTQTFPTVELPAHTPRVALSRGMACEYLNQELVVTFEESPCAITNGALVNEGFSWSTGLQFSFDAPTTLSMVVLHGVSATRWGLRIEGFNGTAWQTIHVVPETFEGDGLPPGTSDHGTASFTLFTDVPAHLGPLQAVRIVAVELPEGDDTYEFPLITGALEVSIF